ncbi:MAG: TonB-dependent receptor [Bacteroidales bacterium]
MKTLLICLAFCFISLMPDSLTAQQTPVNEDTTTIDEIVVTGTKTGVNRHNVPMTISVVTGKQIEESSESALLPVLSEQVPGVFITERGITGFGVSTGSAGSISIRGIGGSPNTQTLILLNGNPQFMGIMGHPLPDAYIASDVEKVEVIRGPASTLYGSNAMGGVINIITRDQKKEGLSANARLMYGSYNTQKYMVNTGYKKNGFNVLASFNHDQTDGHRDSSDFSINNGYLSTGYKINEHLRLEANFSLANFDATDPGKESDMAGETIDITRGMGAFSFTNIFEKTNGSVRFFYNFGEHDITDGFHSKDKNFGTVVYQSFNFFKGNTLTFGIDYKQYGGMAENVKAMGGQGLQFVDTTVQEIAGYAYIQQMLFEKLTLNAGFRLEHNSMYGTEPVPSVGLAYHPFFATTVKASVAKGFRSPTIRELYMWGTANDELNPEKMTNYELSIEQRFLKNKVTAEFTVFKAEGDNLIKTVAESGITKYRNTGNFSNLGIEFAGSYKPLDNLSVRANYSYISMDEPIIATPEHHFNLSSTYQLKKFTATLSVQSVHNLYTRTSPTAEKESYTLLNTRLAYKFNKYCDLFIKGENLTNQDYCINYDYPMPGFIAFAGINLHY